MAKNIYVEVKTNIPEIITFKFSTWKVWENEGRNGKYKSYSIGVEWKGQNAYFSVGEGVYKAVFEQLGDLKDRTLEVMKYEDGKYKKWKVTENGHEISLNARNGTTPSQTPQTNPNTQTNQQTQQGGNSEAIRAWAIKVATEIEGIKKRLDEIDIKYAELEKTLGFAVLDLDGLKGALLNEENMKAFKFHRGVTKPFREEMEKAQSQATETDNGFLNEEGIEIRTDLEELAKDNYLDK